MLTKNEVKYPALLPLNHNAVKVAVNAGGSVTGKISAAGQSTDLRHWTPAQIDEFVSSIINGYIESAIDFWENSETPF